MWKKRAEKAKTTGDLTKFGEAIKEIEFIEKHKGLPEHERGILRRAEKIYLEERGIKKEDLPF